MSVGFAISEATWKASKKPNQKVGALFIDVAESKEQMAVRDVQLWKQQYPEFLKSLTDGLKRAGGFWADPMATLTQGMMKVLQVILKSPEAGVTGPAVYNLCMFVQSDVVKRCRALRQDTNMPDPIKSLHAWLDSGVWEKGPSNATPSSSSCGRHRGISIAPPACLDDTRVPKRSRTFSPPPPPPRSPMKPPDNHEASLPSAPEWYKRWHKDVLAASEIVALYQACEEFRGPVGANLDPLDRKSFRRRYAENDYPRFHPRLSQTASDAVNRLIAAFHRALQYKFVELGIAGNRRCECPAVFAARGQMVGRWITYLIETCGDPSTLSEALHQHWIHSEAAQQVVMQELEILQLDKHTADRRGCKQGAVMPKFYMPYDEQLLVAAEAVDAYELSLFCCHGLPANSAELRLYLDQRVAAMRARDW